MLKNIIIIENENSVQCESLEDVVKILIDKNFYNLTEKDKIDIMKKKALANCLNNKMKVLEIDEIKDVTDFDHIFIIKDEITYIFSLLKTNNILLLENKESNIFTKELDKKDFKDNYVVVNTFANELLKKYLVL